MHLNVAADPHRTPVARTEVAARETTYDRNDPRRQTAIPVLHPHPHGGRSRRRHDRLHKMRHANTPGLEATGQQTVSIYQVAGLGVGYSRVYLLFLFHTSTFQLLNKPWSQVSSLLSPGSCLQFLSRVGFSNHTARRFLIEWC